MPAIGGDEDEAGRIGKLGIGSRGGAVRIVGVSVGEA